MFLLDVQYNPKNSTITKWISINKNNKFIDEVFYPKIFLSYNKELIPIIKSLPYIKDVSIDEKKTWLNRDKEKVVCITIEQNYSWDFASMLEKRGCKLYNIDINPVRQYLLKENLFPFAKLKENYQLDDNQEEFNYEIPNISSVNLSIIPKKEKGIFNYSQPIDKITLGDIIIDKGSESEIIDEFCYLISCEDPDLIFTENGDSFELPYLYNRASQYGIDVQLGRVGNQQRMNDVKDKRKDKRASSFGENSGKSYFSYGRIYYKPKKYTLAGRLHIDRSSFMYREGGLLGLIDLARITRIPLQDIARISPGSAITALQSNKALQENVLVPWKRNIAENWKTAEELLIADRGALVLEPKVGLHEDVWELDFASLFPNIMVNHNISPETVLCKCCSNSKVPFIHYNICEKNIGLIPRVLKPLIERRMTYKNLYKINAKNEKAKEYEMKQNVLKWLLVTSFGYMGYNKARFGRIECHESITAYARETMELADNMGLDILHGIVDCLWVKQKQLSNKQHDKQTTNPEKLCEIAYKEIGIPLELKGKFYWIVFLPNKSNGSGSPSRYYGLKTDGELKIRGIEIRRSDTPLLIKALQKSMLEKLAEAISEKEFYNKIFDAIEILREYTVKVLNDECDINDMILETRISRKCDDYLQFNNQVAALKQFRQEGIEILPGQSICYIITDHKSKNYQKRVIIPELTDDDTHYDRIKYYEFLLRASESITFWIYDEKTR